MQKRALYTVVTVAQLAATLEWILDFLPCNQIYDIVMLCKHEFMRITLNGEEIH